MKRFDAFLEFTCERSRMDLRKIRIFDIEPLELPDPSVKQRWRWRNTRGDAPFHSYIGERCDDSIYVFRPDCVWSVFVYLGFFFDRSRCFVLGSIWFGRTMVCKDQIKWIGHSLYNKIQYTLWSFPDSSDSSACALVIIFVEKYLAKNL